MFRQLVPYSYVPSIYHINVEELRGHGVKGMIFDLDNTLVESDRPDATPELLVWLKEITGQGIQVIIVSNNNQVRVRKFAEPLDIPFIHAARKPFSRAFVKALSLLNTKRHETVVVGDQLLTDVLGGNRMGLKTILVVPVSKREGFFTKVNRLVERGAFRWMRKRGYLG
ncbi:YqeG family HAD IIIA-type phosphatase [Thermoactinomyces sp. DSM 45892]|uniref:YqeG family HAD IIIA-type phosphatase n=1 Tax=Thermoactinomyces sp. DSM 45892 TaxID=1882753 RepID=UPI000896FC9F|nr:YqeG family HAD IIIA-type phosphatase [Thermoactinomyces sp. DSM 45892]SDZ24298.1 hypothetical protein SAMN05444416_11751 [Thermoactinomyces sp. DSM 45892]